VGLERGPLSLLSVSEELVEWKHSGSESRKPRLTAEGIRCADQATPSIRRIKVCTNFAGKGQSLGRYSSLVDGNHGVYYYYFSIVNQPCEEDRLTIGLSNGLFDSRSEC
jgi:hypothetical protein